MTECLNSDDDDEENQRRFSSFFETVLCRNTAAAGALHQVIFPGSPGTRPAPDGMRHKRDIHYDITQLPFVYGGLIRQ